MKKYFSILTKGIGSFSRMICKGIGLAPIPGPKKWLFTDRKIEAFLEPKATIIAELPE